MYSLFVINFQQINYSTNKLFNISIRKNIPMNLRMTLKTLWRIISFIC